MPSRKPGDRQTMETFLMEESTITGSRSDTYQNAWHRYWNFLPSRHHPWYGTPTPSWFQSAWEGYTGGEEVPDIVEELPDVLFAEADTVDTSEIEAAIKAESDPEKASFLQKVLVRFKTFGKGALKAADKVLFEIPSLVFGLLYDAAVSSGLAGELKSWMSGDSNGSDVKALLEDNGISIDDDGGVIGFTPGEPDLGEPEDEQIGFTPGEPDLGPLPGPGREVGPQVDPATGRPVGFPDEQIGFTPGEPDFGEPDRVDIGTGSPGGPARFGGPTTDPRLSSFPPIDLGAPNIGGRPTSDPRLDPITGRPIGSGPVAGGEPGTGTGGDTGGGGLGATEGPLFVETAGEGAFADEQLRIEEAFNQYGTDVGAATDIFTGTTAGIMEDWEAYQTYLDTTNQEITANIDLATEDVKAAYSAIGTSFDADIAAARSPENQLGVKLPGYMGGASFQLNPGAAINSAINIANTRGGLAGDEAGSVLDLIGASGAQLDRFSSGTTTALGNRATLSANDMLARVGAAEAKRRTADEAMELLLTERSGQYGVARAGAGQEGGSIWDSLLPIFAYRFNREDETGGG